MGFLFSVFFVKKTMLLFLFSIEKEKVVTLVQLRSLKKTGGTPSLKSWECEVFLGFTGCDIA
jgi:hypothetical protein